MNRTDILESITDAAESAASDAIDQIEGKLSEIIDSLECLDLDDEDIEVEFNDVVYDLRALKDGLY